MGVYLLIFIQMLTTASISKELTLNGNIAAAFVPLNETGYLDLTSIPSYAGYLASKNIPAVFVGGTAGEGPNINMNERQQLFQAWVTAARPYGLKVIGQVGGLSSFYDVLSLAQSCEDIGLDAIAALPNLYYRPKTAQKAVKDLKMISDAAPSLPIMFYEVSSFTQVPNTAELYRLGCQTIPQFIGIKTPISSALNIAAKRDPGCHAAILVSDFKSVRAAFELGFNGTITEAGSLFPDLVNMVERSAGTFDVLGAEAAQARLNYVMTRIRLGDPASVANSKAAMEMLTGIKMGDPRAPVVSLTHEEKQAMSRSLEQLGVPLVKPVR